MHYGSHNEQTAKVEKLVEQKAQLEAALPVVDDNRAMMIEARIEKIEAQLDREIQRAQAIGNVDAIRRAMGIDGTGGLEFQAQAPAGLGRMMKVPFYPTSGATGYITGAGNASASSTVPALSFLSASTGNAANIEVQNGGAVVLQTPQISWATLRIVGFEVSMDSAANAVSTAKTSSNDVFHPKLLVSDLKIGGGANLFTHEDYADASIYDAAQPEFCGLRDYPLLKSPNQAQVTVAAVGAIAGNAAGTTALTFACSLLCEVLQDDNYGSHIPGPYARSGAMVRRGGSFIS